MHGFAAHGAPAWHGPASSLTFLGPRPVALAARNPSAKPAATLSTSPATTTGPGMPPVGLEARPLLCWPSRLSGATGQDVLVWLTVLSPAAAQAASRGLI